MPLKHLDTSQKGAAASNGSEITVTAGAGSGKTRLLVGRYLFLLKSKSASMQEIAAITFTEKAAGQMKGAVAERAYELSREYASDADYWLTISRSVHEAPISTIHAFCNGILRRYPREAGIDPQYTILDEATLAELIGKAVDGHIAARLDSSQEEMGELLYSFGLSKLKKMLISMLGKRSEFITYFDTNGDVTAGELVKQYRSHCIRQCVDYIDQLAAFHTFAPGDDSLTPVIEELSDMLKEYRTLCVQERHDRTLLEGIINLVTSNIRKGSPQRWGGEHLAEVKKGIKDVRSFMQSLSALYDTGEERTARLSASLFNEFHLLESRFLALKKEMSSFDHDDSLIETWRLLRNNASVLNEVSKSYKHILVDEFQDTDPVQVDILRMIAGNSSAALFTVGDPKQSIYKFRGADVAAFNSFITASGVDFHALKTNYRSVPGIIDFVNRFFGQVMGREHASDYEAVYTDMKPNRNDGAGVCPVEVVVFDMDDTVRLKAEASFIATTIEKLRKLGDYSYRDMAVIVRKGKNTGIYAGEFLARGIPYVNITSGDPGSLSEATDCGHLLGWLAQPTNHVAFAALLMSPFFALDPGSIYGIKLLAESPETIPAAFIDNDRIASHPWFDGLNLGRIRQSLRELLAIKDRCTIREILERAFDLTGYTLTILADQVQGDLSLSVVDKICEAADVFESGGGSLADFAVLLSDGSIAEELVPSVEAGGDAVTILTIHKSKGLQYNVVFLSDITARMKPGYDMVGVHSLLGLGFDIRNNRNVMEPSFVKTIIDTKEALKAIAESKRLFYVGCTRAEDRLFILGGKPSDKSDILFEKNNWMGWLFAAFDISDDGVVGGQESRDLFTFTRIEPDEEPATPPDAVNTDARPEEADKYSGFSGFPVVPAPAFPEGKPSHLSPTQLLDYIECPALYLLRHVHGVSPRISAPSGGGFGEQYGSFAHRVLEHLPLRRNDDGIAAGLNYIDYSETAMQRLVEEFAGEGIPDSWKLRLQEELHSFTTGGLFGEIASSGDVRREVPFGFILEDVLIRGAIDCVFRTDDSVAIVDFKTDSEKPSAQQAHTERYRLQVGMYGLAVDKALYETPSRLIVHYLSSGVSDTIDCSRAFLDGITGALIHAVSSIETGDYSPRHSDRCERCLYKAMCEKMP